MKVEYINPFIEASQSVIKTLTDTMAVPGKIFIKTSPYELHHLIVMVGVVGDIKGQVFFEMNYETAQKIASAMIDWSRYENPEEMCKSAVAELGNMIMGHTCAILARSKTRMDITPPAILTGDSIQITNKMPTVVFPLDLKEYGCIYINIASEEILE